MPLKRAVALLAILLTACGPAPRAVHHPAPAASGEFVRLVSPFPVLDSTGAALELPFLGGWNTPRPQLFDMDGDGRLDLLVQDGSRRMVLLRNRGAGPDGVPRFAFGEAWWQQLDVGEWSRVVDLDRDGAPEVFAELPFSHIRLWRRTGGAWAASDSLRDLAGAPIFSDRQNIPQFVDLDCDGRLDLLVGRVAGTILHYEAEGQREGVPTFALRTERFQDLEIVTGQGSRHGANTMALVDVDGDGDLDLLWGDFFEAGLLLFENTGSCGEPMFRREGVRFPRADPVVTSGYNAPAMGDVNGDGRPDLVVGVIGGAYDPNRTTITNLWYFEGSADGAFTRRTGRLVSQLDVGSESAPVLADVDRDGDLDLLVANKIEPGDRRTSRVFLFENVGTRGKPRLVARGALPIGGRYHMAPAAGDLDGDGDADLVLGSFGASLAWARNDGGRFTVVDTAIATIPRGSNTMPALGDLDGDGDLDLLVGEASGGLNHFRNDGSRAVPRFALVTEAYGDIRIGRRSAPHLVDIDGDGDLDLLVGSDEAGLALFRNEGTVAAPRFVRDTAFALDAPPLAAPAAGDLDGDGRAELLLGGNGGGLTYFARSAP